MWITFTTDADFTFQLSITRQHLILFEPLSKKVEKKNFFSICIFIGDSWWSFNKITCTDAFRTSRKIIVFQAWNICGLFLFVYRIYCLINAFADNRTTCDSTFVYTFFLGTDQRENMKMLKQNQMKNQLTLEFSGHSHLGHCRGTTIQQDPNEFCLLADYFISCNTETWLAGPNHLTSIPRGLKDTCSDWIRRNCQNVILFLLDLVF